MIPIRKNELFAVVLGIAVAASLGNCNIYITEFIWWVLLISFAVLGNAFYRRCKD